MRKNCLSISVVIVLLFSFSAYSKVRYTNSVKHYKARKGDSLWKISKRMGLSYSLLVKYNKKYLKNALHPGDRIIIPVKKAIKKRKKRSRAVKKQVRKSNTQYLKSICNGKVTLIDVVRGYGTVICVQKRDMSIDIYSSKNLEPLVKPGETVTRGQTIGKTKDASVPLNVSLKRWKNNQLVK